MLSSKKTWLFALVVLSIITGLWAIQKVKQGSAAYIYGYPLVLMDLTRQAMEEANRPETRTNQFTHYQIFPDHDFRNVVRPNNDTLYSIAWLDLNEEPIVLSVPDTHGRYYVMPLMDAWTNVYTMIGKRTYGTQAGHFVLSGPDWEGALPEGTTRVPSPTNMVWMIGRIQTDGKDDVPAVARLQKQFTLTPLSRWGQRLANQNHYSTQSTTESAIDPNRQIEQMMAVEFFGRLAALMNAQPPAPEDGPMLLTLQKIGISPGEKFAADKLNFVNKYLLNLAIDKTHSGIRQKIENRSAAENGWIVQRDTIGEYGTNYAMRTAVAIFGLGALPPKEAAYPNASVDSDGEKLTGANSYSLYFAPGQTPPVEAFWSLTMYDEPGFLVENPINRYLLGDRDPLTYNADGSLNLLIQHDRPTERESNWLPAPRGVFVVTMRIYHPKQEFLDGSWKLPPIIRVD